METNNNLTKTNEQKENDIIYAALKLIECLYKQGKIKKHIYKNILKDYAERIDISDF